MVISDNKTIQNCLTRLNLSVKTPKIPNVNASIRYILIFICVPKLIAALQGGLEVLLWDCCTGLCPFRGSAALL